MKRLISLFLLTGILVGLETYGQTFKTPDYGSIQKAAKGKVMPTLEFEGLLNGPDNTHLTPQSLKGQVVILEFWATWCAPCIKQFPKINALAREFEKDVTFISVTAEDEETVNHFLKRKELNTWIGMDQDRSIIEHFGVFAYPTTVVIDKEGIVLAYIKPDELNHDYLNRLIAGDNSRLEAPSTEKKTNSFASSLQFGSPTKDKADNANTPTYEVTLEEINPIPESSGSWSKGFGFLNVQGWTVKKLLSVATNTSELLIQGADSLLDKQFKAKVKLPPGDAKTFEYLLKEAVKSELNIDLSIEEGQVEVLILTAPNGVSSNMRESKAENGHHSSDDGILAAVKSKLDILVPSLEAALGMKVLNETNLAGEYDLNLYWDHEHPESIKEAIENQLGLVLKTETRSINILKLAPKAAKRKTIIRRTNSNE